MRVAGGPFAGMLYLPQAAGSVIVAKLVGTYESELHGAVFDALARGYETVVDVGCAEGYYAVGFARCLREAQVITYDIDPMARRLCDALARANGVRGRVAIRCECTPARLIEVRQRRGLAILDCEGYEADLINDDVAAGLAGWDFLIEAHETERPGVTEVLSSRLAPTHTLAVIDVQTKRPEDFRAVMALPEGMRAAALDEGRVGLQRWIWAKSRLRS